jgi:D-cysteine desulfhydrase
MRSFVEPSRVSLALLPTPIENLDVLSRELGVQLLVKRDDLTGTVLTGNKIRKLEYVLAEAVSQQADVVITCGGAQSNHCRATAAAARRIGLEVELFLRGAREAPVEGNLFLALLLGATVHPITAAEYQERDRLMRARAEELGGEGRRAYVIPEGASTPLGALGYVRCMEELVSQCTDSGVVPDFLVCAVGSGGTLAGLLAGAEVHGFPGEIIGIPVCDDSAWFHRIIDGLLDGLRQSYIPSLAARVPHGGLIDGHQGPGYGQASVRDLEHLRDVAVLTGLVLDPVYTNKAFAGLLDLIRTGRIPKGATVIFLHTGGLFGLFPFREKMPHLMVP